MVFIVSYYFVLVLRFCKTFIGFFGKGWHDLPLCYLFILWLPTIWILVETLDTLHHCSSIQCSPSPHILLTDRYINRFVATNILWCKKKAILFRAKVLFYYYQHYVPLLRVVHLLHSSTVVINARLTVYFFIICMTSKVY